MTLFVRAADLDGCAGGHTQGHPTPTLLLPLYDEATLTYPKVPFLVAEDHPNPPGKDLFVGIVVVDEVNVGTWRRTFRAGTVLVETTLAPSVSSSKRAAVGDALRRLARFLEKELGSLPEPAGFAP